MIELPTEIVQNYPRPPSLESVGHRLRIRLGGEWAADTKRGFRVLETHHAPTYYFPPDDVHAELAPARGGSFCEWKGRAVYWDVAMGRATASASAWSYPSPTEGFTQIAGYLAFYAHEMDSCFVGEEQVIPQTGSFYGGWVTTNLRGRIKGAAGTEHW